MKRPKKKIKNQKQTFIILSEDRLEHSGLTFDEAKTNAKKLVEDGKTDVKILKVTGVWLVYFPEEPDPVISKVPTDELEISI